jgi:hypothetical protein
MVSVNSLARGSLRPAPPVERKPFGLERPTAPPPQRKAPLDQLEPPRASAPGGWAPTPTVILTPTSPANQSLGATLDTPTQLLQAFTDETTAKVQLVARAPSAKVSADDAWQALLGQRETQVATVAQGSLYGPSSPVPVSTTRALLAVSPAVQKLMGR